MGKKAEIIITDDQLVDKVYELMDKETKPPRSAIRAILVETGMPKETHVQKMLSILEKMVETGKLPEDYLTQELEAKKPKRRIIKGAPGPYIPGVSRPLPGTKRHQKKRRGSHK